MKKFIWLVPVIAAVIIGAFLIRYYDFTIAVHAKTGDSGESVPRYQYRMTVNADEEQAPKMGNWTILKSKDSMTDKINCTGAYKEEPGILLQPDGLYIKIPGGVKNVILRFGNDPEQPRRLARKFEDEAEAVVISGAELETLRHSNRLRVRVVTVLNGLAEKDLDVTGIDDAMKSISSCEDSGASGDSPRP